jgi:hypothetical protein
LVELLIAADHLLGAHLDRCSDVLRLDVFEPVAVISTMSDNIAANNMVFLIFVASYISGDPRQVAPTLDTT